MGCCGRDNKRSTNMAGIFAIIQSIVGFSLAIYNLNVFNGVCYDYVYNVKEHICSVLYGNTSVIRGLLIFVLVLYIFWIISSIFLLIGNAQNKAGFVRQWVGLSIVVIIGDVVLSGVLVAVTYSAVIDQITRDTNPYNNGFSIVNVYTYSDYNLTWNYMVLILAVSRGGLITWICDIALTVYASRRAAEIRNPPATYVYTLVLPTTTVVSINYPGPQYIKQEFVPPQQGYVVQQQRALPYYQPGQQFNQPLPYPATQFPKPVDGSDNLGPPPTYTSIGKGNN